MHVCFPARVGVFACVASTTNLLCESEQAIFTTQIVLECIFGCEISVVTYVRLSVRANCVA